MTPSAEINWQDPPPIHIVGIGGMAMSAIAQIALDRNARVSGSDLESSPYTDRLASQGVKVTIGHASENVNGTGLLVYSAAIDPGNPELVAARELGLPLVDRAQFIASLLAEKRTIAVAGTHGKTTTAAMASFALTRLGHLPTYLIGAQVPQLSRNAAWGSGPLAVVEADEYARAFLAYDPQSAIIGHLEIDHLDLYGSWEQLRAAFAQFAAKVPAGGTLIARTEIAAVATAVAAARARVVSFGVAGTWQLAERRASGFGQLISIRTPAGNTLGGRLQVPGQHNALNALAATAALAEQAIDPVATLSALAEFSGTDRRFALAAKAGGITLIDDYAHHPTEIAAAIAAARELDPPPLRLWVVFQPHLRSRTAALFDQFAGALAGADKVTVCHIYSPPGRDREHSVSAKDLAQAVGDRAEACADFEQAFTQIATGAEPGDLILALGAGDVIKLSGRLAGWLRAQWAH